MAHLAVKETKEMLMFVLTLGMAFDKADADGKIDLSDAGHFIMALGPAPAAFQDLSQIPKEIEDIDAAELQELYNYVETNLNLGHAKTEKMVKLGLVAVKSLAEIYMVMKT